MEEKGTIIKNRGQDILVKIERHSACSKCDRDCGLAMASDIEETVVEINKGNYNDIYFNEGQQVILEMEEKSVVLSAFIVYIFPLVAMIGGYFALSGFSQTEAAGIIGSLFGFVISFLLIRIINQKYKFNNKFEPRIKKIINQNKGVENIE